MGVFYCTREQFQAAAISVADGLSNQTVDRLLESKSRLIEQNLGRHFFPFVQTRYYDWPPQFGLSSIRLYLNADLLSVTSITVAGVALTSYFLEPINYTTDAAGSAAYSRIEVNLSATGSAFTSGSTPQRSIAVAGTWGYSSSSVPAGSLAAAISTTAGTSVTVSDSSLVGVGDLVLVDSERFLVTEKTLLTTGTTVSGTVTADNSVVTIPVVDGTKVLVGETITVDAERMYVQAIVGNNLNVTRAYQGTVLAAHTNSTVYAPRTCTVTRAAAGTTAATHSNATTLTRNLPPQLVSDLCLAEAIATFHQEKAGYARTVGTGEFGMSQVSGRPLADLRAQTAGAYGRVRGPVAV